MCDFVDDPSNTSSSEEIDPVGLPEENLLNVNRVTHENDLSNLTNLPVTEDTDVSEASECVSIKRCQVKDSSARKKQRVGPKFYIALNLKGFKFFRDFFCTNCSFRWIKILHVPPTCPKYEIQKKLSTKVRIYIYKPMP